MSGANTAPNTIRLITTNAPYASGLLRSTAAKPTRSPRVACVGAERNVSRSGCDMGTSTTRAAPDRLAGESNTGVEYAINGVRNQVQDGDQERRDEDDPHQPRIILPKESVVEQTPHARPGEDGLGDDRAGEERGKIECNHGEHGNSGVAHRVTKYHVRSGDAFGARHVHVVHGLSLIHISEPTRLL